MWPENGELKCNPLPAEGGGGLEGEGLKTIEGGPHNKWYTRIFAHRPPSE